MDHIKALIENLMPGVYVTALEVTGSAEGSVFTGIDTQVLAPTESLVLNGSIPHRLRRAVLTGTG